MLCVAVAVKLLPLVFAIGEVRPIIAASMGGLLLGVGMLIIIRHKGSVGGTNILSLWIQDKYNFSAGKVQLILDALIIGSAVYFTGAQNAMLSLVSVVAINIVLITNHKKGRYTGY